ncbi:MAG: ABC transporter ATP-binding protein, partial [Bosea sp. (in: a-proteobacteria)]
DYPGTVLIVSHDRDFIDRVVTSTLISDGDGRWTEYAGGYSDMIAQRGEGVRAKVVQNKAAAAAEPVVVKAASAAASKRKMTFNDKHALETLPKTIEALQAETVKLNAALAGDLYARDAALFAKVSARLATVTAEISAAEERWLELEMLREDMGA